MSGGDNIVISWLARFLCKMYFAQYRKFWQNIDNRSVFRCFWRGHPVETSGGSGDRRDVMGGDFFGFVLLRKCNIALVVR